MRHRTALYFLLIIFFISACKKKVDPNQFEISYVQDVVLEKSKGLTVVSVKHTSGEREAVTISLPGLPAGITADITPNGYSTDFDPLITFFQSGSAVPGAYPMKIVGTAASYTKGYDFRLIVPELNGWIIDDTVYHKREMYALKYTDFYQVYIESRDLNNLPSTLLATILSPFPAADGTYTYQLVSKATAPGEMELQLGNFYASKADTLTGMDHHTATVQIKDGTYSLVIPPTAVSNGRRTAPLKLSASYLY